MAKIAAVALTKRKLALDERGVHVNRASSRCVRPGLRDHRVDLTDLPHTYRL